MTLKKSKKMLVATAILVAAILSFPACNKDEVLNPHNPKSDGQDYTKFTLQFMSAEFQSSEFINDILEGRIVSIEWVKHTAFTGYPYYSDGLVHFRMLEELSKPGEIWFEESGKAIYQDGYNHGGWPLPEENELSPNFRFKFEKHPEISGAILATQYYPQRHGLTNELLEWREETSLKWVITEKNEVVYRFKAPGQFETSGWYWVEDLYIKQPGTVDRMIHISTVWSNGGSNNPEDLSDVVESVFKNLDIDLVRVWDAQNTIFREPHQFKITRK